MESTTTKKNSTTPGSTTTTELLGLATPEELRSLQEELNGLLQVLRKNHVRRFKTATMDISLHKVIEEPMRQGAGIINKALLDALDKLDIDPDHPAAKNVALQLEDHLKSSFGNAIDDTDEDDDIFTEGVG